MITRKDKRTLLRALNACCCWCNAAGNSTRYRVLVSKDDTAGEYFTIEMLIRPQAYGAVRDKPGLQPAHYHIIQEEHIKVKEGRLGYYIGHHTHVKAAEEGEEVVVKPGNIADMPLHLL